jgi:hypothetical protein
MDCRKTRSMITSYIDNKLKENLVEDFLKHVKKCSDCADELEVYFVVASGLKVLDGEAEDEIADYKEALKVKMLQSEVIIKNNYRKAVVKYSIFTLETICVIIIVLLRFRIWF